GSDAIALASSLAHTQEAELLIVHVLDGPSPGEASFREERASQELRYGAAQEWLADAVGEVTEGVSASGAVVYADSVAEGLLDAAREADAALIVVSAARYGPLRRFTVGSV